MMIIAIDPGTLGGIAWQDSEGRIVADPMPESMTEIWAYLDNLVFYKRDNWKGVMEKVGTYMPGNSGPAAATFARHCGWLDMALYALKIPCEEVSPQTWMKGLGTWPKDKMERKRAIKEAMQRQYPQIKVTLKTADALALLTWYLKKGAK